MRKTFLVKTVALVVCLVFIGLSASGLFAADRKSSKGRWPPTPQKARPVPGLAPPGLRFDLQHPQKSGRLQQRFRLRWW